MKAKIEVLTQKSVEIAMQDDDGAILRTNLQTLRAELEETSALFDSTPSLELLIKGEELREEIDRIRQQIIDILRQEAWKRSEQRMGENYIY